MIAESQETSIDVSEIDIVGTTRSVFLVKSTLAVGTVYGATMVGPYVRQAFAGSSGTEGDVEILNYALTLEFLEADFYANASKYGVSGEAAELATLIEEHEKDHVKTLSGTIKDLGGKPVAEPKFEFPVNNEKEFLKLAQTLEDTGVSAYNGAAPKISSSDVLTAAGAIVQVEARHAAAIRGLRGQPAAPNAFDKTLTEAQVLKAVAPLIVK